MNIPQVEAGDNLGGDKKEREFNKEQGTSDVVGMSSRSASSRTRTPGTKLPRPCQTKHPTPWIIFKNNQERLSPNPSGEQSSEKLNTEMRGVWM